MKTVEDIIKSQEYDFLQTNEHLKDKIIFLTFGGSHAYGTNIETSDIDIRGCALNSKQDLIGLSSFEQVVHEGTDTTIYAFNKLIGLLMNCNPNVIESLGCKPEHYFNVTKIGQELLDNRKMFLSKKAVHSFGGYAIQQLRRLENALARDTYEQTDKELHMMKSCMSAMRDFENRYAAFEEGSIKLHIEKSDKEDLETEIFADINLQSYPLRDYKNIWSDMNTIIKDYGKLNKRNHKKDNAHLNKHAMHLVRLYLMCIDILEKEEIITYRENDRELLLSIRNGCFQKEDGTYRPDFFELIDDLERRMNVAKEQSNLPKTPNYNDIEDFVMSVNERVIRGDY